MANYTLPYPYGIDYYIEKAQTRLYDYLLQRCGLSGTPNKYNSFGRVYRVSSENGFIPMAKVPEIKDYVNSKGIGGNGALFFEDSLAIVSYFYLPDALKKNGIRDDVAKIELYFFVDLSKITTGGITDAQGQRLDEVLINDVKNFMQNNGCGLVPMDTTRNVDMVLDKFSGSLKKDTINDDMNPKFCFKIIHELHYNPVLFATPQQKQLLPMQKSVVLYIKTTPDTTNLYAVGNGKYMYAEYAPGNTLKPLLNDGSSTGYLAGKSVELPFQYNDGNDSLPDFNLSTGIWTRTGAPFGFNNTDYVTITFTDLT